MNSVGTYYIGVKCDDVFIKNKGYRDEKDIFMNIGREDLRNHKKLALVFPLTMYINPISGRGDSASPLRENIQKLGRV